ncbi:pre-mRNA-splicing factor ISY1 homolog [Styela clava]
MARSAEKAMTALARFRRMKMEEGKVVERRPYIASDCDNLQKAEKWRRQILGEISRKVAQIQNAGLIDHQIRDLNDDINKLLREKKHWEDRIIELGGPNYKRIGPRMLDHEGKTVPGNRGYKYFGAAKDLPGVRELFQRDAPSKKRKTRGQLMRNLDADYYGYRDEDDGVLVPLEKEVEAKLIAEAVEEWKASHENDTANITEITSKEEDIYATDNPEVLGEQYEADEGKPGFVAHVPVPSQKEVEDALLRRKKRELLEQYASETLQMQSSDARTLLGI